MTTQVRILDLDSFSEHQPRLLARAGIERVNLRDLGPRIRIACPWRAFQKVRAALSTRTNMANAAPHIVFGGSGDFHHVTLALLETLKTELNLLVVDKHPDWVQRIPFLHCGTWLAHALRLSNIHTIIHVGGELDFDNGYRWLAPWNAIEKRRIFVIPAHRRFKRGRWRGVPQEPLRGTADEPASRARIESLIEPLREELGRRPLYVSIDKDALRREDAVCNWDQGILGADEIHLFIEACMKAANGRLAGADIVGDWSAVVTRGILPGLMKYEHPRVSVNPGEAGAVNERTNMALLDTLIAASNRSN